MTSGKRLLSYTTSHVGLVRTKNDDSSYAGSYLTIVADGMGGHAGGDTASSTTVLELIHLDRRCPDQTTEDIKHALVDSIQAANSSLNKLAAANPELTGMGTTVSALLLANDKLHFAHIGDSRAYRLKNKVFEQISTDHTYVQQLVNEGRLSPAEAAIHPNKNVVTRILGDVNVSPEIDSQTFDATCGERWLLCSDGLTDVVHVDVIAAHMRRQAPPKDIVDNLVTLTLEAGSPDNVTVALFDVVASDAKLASYSQTILVPELISDALSLQPDANLSETAVEKFLADTSSAGYDPRKALASLHFQAQLQTRPHLLTGAASLVLEQANAPVTQQIVERFNLDRQPQQATGKEQEPITTIDAPTTNQRQEQPSKVSSQPPSAIQPDAPAQENTKSSAPTKEKKLHKNFFSRYFYTFLAVIVVVILTIAAFLTYSWIQTQYFIGVADDKVAIFRGIPQHVGPLSFSTLEETTQISLDDLEDHAKNSVNNTIGTSSKETAQQIINDLPLKKSNMRQKSSHTMPIPSSEGGSS